MSEIQKAKSYDLEERTFNFAKDVRSFIKQLPHSTAYFEDARQLVRSSGSLGANYIEANEALSKKDFLHRIKISKKETKETIFWLRLIETGEDIKLQTERARLINESTELMKIFGSIYRNSE